MSVVVAPYLRVAASIAGLAAAAFAVSAQQTYPSRPITTFPPGSTNMSQDRFPKDVGRASERLRAR